MKFEEIKTPCYIIDEDLIENNLKTLRAIMDRTGCKILLAQKAFSNYAMYPLVGKYLTGATASGIFEAKLCYEEMPNPKENHIYSPAFKEEDMVEILEICDHIVFNSMSQLMIFGNRAKEKGLSVGIRINPEKSTQEDHDIYDPCAKGSRLVITIEEFEIAIKKTPELLNILDGIHFHTLCEQNSDALEITLDAVEKKFGKYMSDMQWINFGGGHHITRADYDVKLLEKCITNIQKKYNVLVYLEPGEAIALNSGFLVTTILEILDKEEKIAILDTSAACHMPDVLEMPYRPPVEKSGQPNEKEFTYKFGGPTCLAGDNIGVYSFDKPISEGERIVFCDMAIYSMVKNNTFNGMPLPNIYLKKADEYQLWKSFSYNDFKCRL